MKLKTKRQKESINCNKNDMIVLEKEQNRIHKQLLPRLDIYREMKAENSIPQTTQTRVIIPCLSKTFGFKSNQYKVNEKYLKGVIQQPEFNGLIKKVNQIVEAEIILKSKQENQPFFSIISLLLNISIGIASLSFTMLAFVVYMVIDESTSNTILTISMFLLALTGVIAGLCPIVLYNASYHPMNYEQVIFEGLKKIIAEENKKFSENGNDHLQWRVQPNIFWLELHIQREAERKKMGKVEDDQDQRET